MHVLSSEAFLQVLLSAHGARAREDGSSLDVKTTIKSDQAHTIPREVYQKAAHGNVFYIEIS